ncbi:hypothetical protein B0A50_04875 [Salinomyces thailandicus]|uniref:Uncharacterized protein n=1 Tax=Salinomyces thailandicus TaxID=706561 RepID=A0A4U0TZE3_9PEZI|nr:hypothetical protein B0A50_04875 [Salinomyces thailandica]
MVNVSHRAGSTTEEEDHGLLFDEEQCSVDPDAQEEQQITFRAVLLGSILGGVNAASKQGIHICEVSKTLLLPRFYGVYGVYLGLTTGWTLGASLVGTTFGYAILKPLFRALPT